ncbi:hypothetical protein F4W66_21295 [Escherichia coli]|nr:hypothetical protein F4W66_21295 [Escherichia coli]
MNTYRKPQSVKISPIDKKITTHEVMWLSVNYIKYHTRNKISHFDVITSIFIDLIQYNNSCSEGYNFQFLKNKRKM